MRCTRALLASQLSGRQQGLGFLSNAVWFSESRGHQRVPGTPRMTGGRWWQRRRSEVSGVRANPSVALQCYPRSDKHSRVEASQKGIKAALAQIFQFLLSPFQPFHSPRPIPRMPWTLASFIRGGGGVKKTKKTNTPKHHQKVWFHTNHINIGQTFVKKCQETTFLFSTKRNTTVSQLSLPLPRRGRAEWGARG